VEAAGRLPNPVTVMEKELASLYVHVGIWINESQLLEHDELR